MKRSSLAPDTYEKLEPIEDVRLAVCEAGIRYQGRKDLLLCVFPQHTTVAGVFTKSRTASAPVEISRKHLQGEKARALVVNAGNANAFTGMRGMDAVQKTIAATTSLVGCPPEEVFVASTGVIGEPLQPEKFTHLLSDLHQNLKVDTWHEAAQAIMTTDTYPKLAHHTVKMDAHKVRINGIAKGSGMIAPDMATMLSFIFTDAPIAANVLQPLCEAATAQSFNAITVDGDTSTSDTVLVFATGGATKHGVKEITALDDPRAQDFAGALNTVMRDLAHQIVRDGEGATKFIAIHVSGAENDKAARTIGLSIANSPLVKTAFAGEDPNWGRIVMAVGKSGEAADRDKLSIRFGEHLVATQGEVHPEYEEAQGAAYMKNQDLDIFIDVGVGTGKFTVWTCDLTHDYISINADYRS
ncbi:MAG: bifunctional glutamate N-acetyltransferase/amino-acid acetyltransferase ArgJ [Pseudomonadota bacterium]